MKFKPQRDSSIEFLRILSMLLITLHHFSLWGQGDRADHLIASGNLVDAFKALIYLPLGDIGVYAFVMITGFYLGSKTISCRKSLKKAAIIYTQLYFYSILFLLVGLHYHLPLDNFPNLRDPLMPFNTIPNILMSIFPISFNHYWFVTAYLILLLLIPFINPVLIKLDKKHSLFLLVIMIVTTGIFPLINNHVVSEAVGLGVVLTSYMMGNYINRFVDRSSKTVITGVLLFAINTLIMYAVMYYDVVFLKFRFIRVYTGFFALLAAAGLFLIFTSLKSARRHTYIHTNYHQQTGKTCLRRVLDYRKYLRGKTVVEAFYLRASK